MGVVDVFAPDAKVELKVNDLMQILKDESLGWAQNMCMLNGLKAGLPHEHILIMIGEKEESEVEE